MVIEEHARLEILLPEESEWRNIGENGIINNSLSVSSKCMDDSSFSLGGVYSAQLSVRIRLHNTNTYKVTGAKIKVFSQYGGQNEILRGIFWVTSVSRKNDIYTISASDSLVWLDSTSYDDSGQGENIIYGKLASDVGNLGYKLSQIVASVNELLDNENKIGLYVDTGIVNWYPSDVGYCLLPAAMVGEISTKNPRDYASWLAEIACGFVYVDYSDGTAKIRIGQFSEEVNHEISYDEVELDSCEIADFTLKFKQVYTDVYDGSSGSSDSNRGNGIVIDISENPFKDGHWHYNRVIGSDGEEYGNAMDIIDNIYGKLCGDGGNCHGLKFRPFNLKCHCTKNFQLGQKITLPNGQESWITSIKWQFRGGYTLSCAGKDTRALYASARRSQSAKVKDLAYTKINTEIAKLKNDISDGEFQALKGEKGDKGEQGEKGDKGDAGERGSDGFSPTVEVSENTDNSYILKVTDKNGSFETPNLKGLPVIELLECDTQLSETILECDFKVLSENPQNICFSGDLVLYSESLHKVGIRYFLDDSEINFAPQFSVDGYSTQHLSAFFAAESGEHNFKAVIDSDVTEQVQGRIIGQNIRLVEAKPTTADDFIYFIENDTVKLIFYKGTETRIQIPSEIEGKPVTEIESTCFTDSQLKYAVIPETVEKIY